jgi:alpha,alpha-trehalose phosphorylase
LVDLENRHDNTDHGSHLAAMAGSWLALVWGFAGLRTHAGRPAFRPILPEGLDGYSARIQWRGSIVNVRVDRTRAEYRLVSGPPVEIEHEGERLLLTPEAAALRPWGLGAPLEAVIFDLDGVLTDTAKAHYRAWKRLADEIGVPFDEAANEQLKGVGRLESLDLILGLGGLDLPLATKLELAERKNGYYLTEIAHLGPNDLLPGAREALEAARRLGLKTALASASRNAPQILDRLGIAGLFDAIAEPRADRRGKPAPDLFLAAADLLGVAPARCLALEDSVAGVAAIKAAGMTAIGVGDPTVLAEAERVIPDLTGFRPERPGRPEPARDA